MAVKELIPINDFLKTFELHSVLPSTKIKGISEVHLLNHTVLPYFLP